MIGEYAATAQAGGEFTGVRCIERQESAASFQGQVPVPGQHCRVGVQCFDPLRELDQLVWLTARIRGTSSLSDRKKRSTARAR